MQGPGRAAIHGAMPRDGKQAVQFHIRDTTIAITAPDAATLEAEVRRRLASRQGFALATLNLDHLVKLRASPAFRRAYAAQDIVTADGNPIVWLSRLARRPVTLLPGADLVLPLSRLAAEAGRAVALLGSTGQSLRSAAAALKAAVPGLDVALKVAPPMGFDPDGKLAAEILAELAAAGIGIAFLALGAPKQEVFAARGRSLAPGVGFASVGAGLDFLAGDQRRAPEWVRNLALEWLWRMLGNPARLAGRYLRCWIILPGLAWQAWRSR